MNAHPSLGSSTHRRETHADSSCRHFLSSMPTRPWVRLCTPHGRSPLPTPTDCRRYRKVRKDSAGTNPLEQLVSCPTGYRIRRSSLCLTSSHYPTNSWFRFPRERYIPTLLRWSNDSACPSGL